MSGPETREVNADVVMLLVSMREDICTHLHAIEADVRATKEEARATKEEARSARAEVLDLREKLKGLSGQHQKFTDEIFRLRSELQKTKTRANEAAAQSNESDLKLESDMGQAIVHVGKIDAELIALKGETDKQSQAIGVIAEELGIHDRIAIDTESKVEHPKRPLPRIRRETTLTLFSTFLAIILLTLQLAWRYLEGK